MKTTRKPAEKQAKMSPPSPLDLVSSQARIVEITHDSIAALSLALEEIEYQYVDFSTDAVKDYVRAAIIDKLSSYSKLQCEAIYKLFDRIKALGQVPAAAGGAR
jgi:hypothetical protein